MALVIVPLAGPDFYSQEFGIRPLYKLRNGCHLIDDVLLNRPWISKALKGNGLIVFVLRGFGEHTQIMMEHIRNVFKNAEIVVISSLSMGAPFSAAAAISQVRNLNEPIIVDLADILFDTTIDVDLYFNENPAVSSLIPYFQSSSKKFSYLRLDGDRVLEAKEKQVISSNASAGVYCFRSIFEYLEALTFCMGHEDICKFNNSFFLCPSINGLIQSDKFVAAVKVKNANPIGEIFH